MPASKYREAHARLRSRTGGRREVARGGVLVFIVSSLRELDAFTARWASGFELGAVGVLDDEGRVRMATAAITIQRPLEQVYAFLRDFCNFPRFMTHLDSVETHNDTRSRWRLRLLGGKTLACDVELVDDRPGELIAWRSLPGGEVDNRGTIRFFPAPGGRGTEVHADIRYIARAGGLGILFARMLNRAPGQRAQADLRRLKQLLEVGEVVHSDASIHRTVHAAQASGEELSADQQRAHVRASGEAAQ